MKSLKISLVRFAVIALALLGSSADIFACDFNVSNSIQLANALNQAQSGDKICLAAGTYTDIVNFDLQNKSGIEISGIGGASAVILNGGGAYSVFRNLGPNSKLTGLTIRNTNHSGGQPAAGGLVDSASNAIVRWCIFEDHSSTSQGVNSENLPKIRGCLFRDNNGAAVRGNNGIIRKSKFCNNSDDIEEFGILPSIDLQCCYANPSNPLQCCPGDANYDNKADFTDLVLLLSVWGNYNTTCADTDSEARIALDFNLDRTIGFSDLVNLLGFWGNCSGGLAPASIQEELAGTCLSLSQFNSYMSAVADPLLTEAEKTNWTNWTHYYLNGAQGSAVFNGQDPFQNPCKNKRR